MTYSRLLLPALFSLLGALGVEPDAMLGHSTGESSALAASGAIAFTNREQLADFIRELNKVYRGVLDGGGIATGVCGKSTIFTSIVCGSCEAIFGTR